MTRKSLTQQQIIALISKDTGMTKAGTRRFFDELAKLAFKNAKNGFTIPGLGKLILVNRKARLGRNPSTGAAIKIPAKKVVRFRIAKSAKEAIIKDHGTGGGH
jgi:DNA-binding protein HU-beta